VQPRQLDLTDLPALSHYAVRDGTQFAYRAYPGGEEQVAVLVHGSGTESSVMNPLAKTLQAEGVTVYAPDLRGHLADFVATMRPKHESPTMTLIGCSGVGAFTIRIAGGHYGDLFNRYIVIDPAIVYPSPLARPNAGG
jgi:non-heme chloroperoxidase